MDTFGPLPQRPKQPVVSTVTPGSSKSWANLAICTQNLGHAYVRRNQQAEYAKVSSSTSAAELVIGPCRNTSASSRGPAAMKAVTRLPVEGTLVPRTAFFPRRDAFNATAARG